MTLQYFSHSSFYKLTHISYVTSNVIVLDAYKVGMIILLPKE